MPLIHIPHFPNIVFFKVEAVLLRTIDEQTPSEPGDSPPPPSSRLLCIHPFCTDITKASSSNREVGERNLEKSCALPTETYLQHSSLPFPTLVSPSQFLAFVLPSCLVTPASCLFLACFDLLSPAILGASFLFLLWPSYPPKQSISLYFTYLC